MRSVTFSCAPCRSTIRWRQVHQYQCVVVAVDPVGAEFTAGQVLVDDRPLAVGPDQHAQRLRSATAVRDASGGMRILASPRTAKKESISAA